MFIAAQEEITWRSAKHTSHVQVYFARHPAARNDGTGRPWRSATAMILVPLPRLVFPTLEPPFWQEQNCHL